MRVLSEGRSRRRVPIEEDKWFWIDIAAVSIGVMGLAVVGAYVIVVRVIEWFA